MKHYSTFVARNRDGTREVEGLSLQFNVPVPLGLTVEELEQEYSNEAERVVKALTTHAPQGLVIQILVKLLQHQHDVMVCTKKDVDPVNHHVGA